MKKRVNSQVQVARSLPCNGWTQTKTHICDEITIMFANLLATRVERPVMQTSRRRKDFAQIVPLVVWIVTISVAVGVHEPHVSSHSCDFTNGYFQEQEIDRISLYHIPKREASSGVILVSRLSIYGRKGARAGVMNLVLQKFSTSKEEHGAKGNFVRVQPITHDARCDSTREATKSGVHQEKFNSRFFAWIARQTRSDLRYRISKILSTFEKCLCQRLTCARLHSGMCSIRLHELYQFLFQILLERQRLLRDAATTTSVMNRNNLMKSSRTPESQQADITALEPGDALNAVTMLIRPLSWSLTGIGRICSSSPLIEVYMLSNDVEQGLRTRCVVFNMKRQLIY